MNIHNYETLGTYLLKFTTLKLSVSLWIMRMILKIINVMLVLSTIFG